MASQFFGFEDEEAIEEVEVLDITSKVPVAKTPIKLPSTCNMPISEIQALLGKNPNTDESYLDSSANDSSFYADEDTSICVSQLDSTMEESFSASNTSFSDITVVNGTPRKILKAERKTRKVLGSIGNNNESPSSSTPARNYKKRVPRSVTKNKENQPPKRIKTAKKNIPDENEDELAEQLNKRFMEIENFKLIVE